MKFVSRWLFILFLAVVAVVAVLAAYDNSSLVRLKFLEYESFEWPITFWMMTAFLIGVGFGLCLNVVANLRLRLGARKVERYAHKVEQQLDQQRSEQPA